MITLNYRESSTDSGHGHDDNDDNDDDDTDSLMSKSIVTMIDVAETNGLLMKELDGIRAVSSSTLPPQHGGSRKSSEIGAIGAVGLGGHVDPFASHHSLIDVHHPVIATSHAKPGVLINPKASTGKPPLPPAGGGEWCHCEPHCSQLSTAGQVQYGARVGHAHQRRSHGQRRQLIAAQRRRGADELGGEADLPVAKAQVGGHSPATRRVHFAPVRK